MSGWGGCRSPLPTAVCAVDELAQCAFNTWRAPGGMHDGPPRRWGLRRVAHRARLLLTHGTALRRRARDRDALRSSRCGGRTRRQMLWDAVRRAALYDFALIPRA